MKQRSIWDILDLKPTADRGEIRRAYATQLRLTNPEDDEAGFRELRAAYERALANATGSRGPTQPHEGDPPIVAASVETETVPATLDREVTQTPPAAAARAPLEAECGRLQDLLQATSAPMAGALDAALEAVLSGAALQPVSVQMRIDRWLAGLIVTAAPRSDCLLAIVVPRLGWEDRPRARSSDSDVQRAVDRHRHLIAMRSFNKSKTLKPALKALAGRAWPPMLASSLDPRLQTRVRRLLLDIRSSYPSVLQEFDPGAIARWDNYLSKPRFPPVAIRYGLVWPVLLTGMFVLNTHGRDARWPLVYLALVATIIALGAFQLFGIVLPRRIWRDGRAATAPLWLRLGWAPGVGLLLLASAILPADRPLSIGLGVLSAVAVWWVMITGMPEFRLSARRFQRMAILDALLVLVWWAVIARLQASYWQMTAPFAAGVVAALAGAGSIAWPQGNRPDGAQRRLGLAWVGGLAIVSAALLVWMALARQLMPVAGAMVALTWLACRGPAPIDGYVQARVRLALDFCAGFGLLFLVLSRGFGLPLASPNRDVFGGVCILLSVSVGLVAAWRASSAAER